LAQRQPPAHAPGAQAPGAQATEAHAAESQTLRHPMPTEATEHANGVSGIDHLVAMSPQLDRSVSALQAAGLDLRRIREQPTPAGAPRQAFFRLGEVILEVVQEPENVLAGRADGSGGPARF